MAKQKVKLPVKRASRAKAQSEQVLLGPKRKDARKVKAKAGAELPPGPMGALAKVKSLIKAKRKPQPGGPLRTAMVEGSVDLLDPGIVGADTAAPVAARVRKVRPGTPLGRLERLEIAINEVRVGGRASPRTRKLLASGVPKMAQKVIEEAAEVAIDAIRGEHGAFVHEMVDLFYNLIALCSELGVPLASIWAEMDRREQSLGMAEKLPKSPDL